MCAYVCMRYFDLLQHSSMPGSALFSLISHLLHLSLRRVELLVCELQLKLVLVELVVGCTQLRLRHHCLLLQMLDFDF